MSEREIELDLFGALSPVETVEPKVPSALALPEPEVVELDAAQESPELAVERVLHQATLFSAEDIEPWRAEWKGMGSFTQDDLMPERTLLVHFAGQSDCDAFAQLVEQSIGPNAKYIWFPPAEKRSSANWRWISTRPRNPQWPIYIVSKGRADTRLTVKTFERMGVPFYVVVEEQELAQYAAVIDRARLLVLDPSFQREYETCDELGDTKSKGPGAARNFAWAHAAAAGAPWHWVMDDNIDGFYRLDANRKLLVADGTIFRMMEDFCARYDNVAMAGPNYDFFAKARQRIPPYITNTRIYSCNLIRNSVPYRWRGRYNEDTDLSLQMLKANWCTVQFNAFLQGKTWTQQLKGGCTDDFYAVEGTKPKSEMLARMHPDVARVTFKFQRWHHEVDYSPFRFTRLKRSASAVDVAPDDYGLVLQERVDGKWITRDVPT